jgi:RHS repeat-associated protein
VSQTYDYDRVNRLKEASESGASGWKRTYGYDGWGNRWVDPAPDKSYGIALSAITPLSGSWFGADNRLSNVGYDAAGNQEQVNPYRFYYDEENRPWKGEKTVSGTVYTDFYSYDGDGRRVKKQAGGQTTLYVYDAQGELAAEYPAAGGGGAAVAHDVTTDHLGSTRLVTKTSEDPQQVVVGCYDYLPFGEELPVDRNGRSTVGCYGATGELTQQFTELLRDSFAPPPGASAFAGVAGGGVLGSWTVGGAGVDHIGTYWESADGDGASLDLNGGGPGSVSTSLSSRGGWTAGATYRVSFSLAGNPDALVYSPEATVPGVRVTTATSTQDYFFDVSNIDGSGADATKAHMGWKRITFEFVGAAADTLTFTSLDPAGDPCGVALDAIVVEKLEAVSSGAGGGVRLLFTGKERDWETGLDYFGARYFSGAQGRFTSVDPSMLSTVLANPQSWNRYTYALNNPLRYVDPNGELWAASGDANNPYSWVDECQKNQTCHATVAANVGGNLRVYGSANAQAITNYTANEHGMINVVTLAGNADANFESIQTAGREENYLGVGQAAALFNVAATYGGNYPNDNRLVFTGGSTATGGSAVDANGQPIHRSHRNGSNVDLRYMGDAGSSLTGNTAAGSGNVGRNQYIINQFAGQNAGLGAALTGDPARYGLGPISARLQQIHQDHIHFQRNYPAPPRQEPRIRPGQR